VNGRGFNSHSVHIFALLLLVSDCYLVEVWWGLVGLKGEHTHERVNFSSDVDFCRRQRWSVDTTHSYTHVEMQELVVTAVRGDNCKLLVLRNAAGGVYR
jgi:hypothetical protein